MLSLLHPSLLGIQLFESLIFSELLSHLYLEFVLHSLLFCKPFYLELNLILFGSLQFGALTNFLICLLHFNFTSLLLHQLQLELVSKVLNILSFGSSLCLLLSKL